MSLDAIKITLTSRQVDLLLEYSYPFESEQAQLNKLSEEAGEWHVLITDDFYAPRLKGDLTYSAQEITDEFLLHELDELWEVIESSMMIAAGK